MLTMLSLATNLVACGGDEGAAAPAPEAAPAAPVAAVAPPPAPAPVAEPVAPPSGPYTPDDLAKAAYDKAVAAGADAKPNPKAGDAAAIAAGKIQYDTKCVTCHGANGAGDGIAGSALPQKPGQFTWKERWQGTTIGTKHWVVMNGIQGTGMAPLGLTEDQAWEALAYIEATFAPK